MADRKYISDIEIENAKLIYRNFSGAESTFNKEGDRNFGVIIEDKALAEQMAADGWKLKERPINRDDPEAGTEVWLPVCVKFDNRPPKITKIAGTRHNTLTAATVGCLDNLRLVNVDLVIHPYCWGPLPGTGATGVKAYLSEMYVEVESSNLSEKYAWLDAQEDENA